MAPAPSATLLALASALPLACTAATYTPTITRLSSTPILSGRALGGASFASWTYNAAAFPIDDSFALLVRCQNSTSTTNPYAPGPSFFSYTSWDAPFVNPPPVRSTTFGPSAGDDACGTEDPRVAFNRVDGQFYMFYTAYDCKQARLAIATSRAPADPSAWVKQGPALDFAGWSKSGSVLFGDSPASSALIWGDSSDTNPAGEKGLRFYRPVNASTFLLWTNALPGNDTIFLPTRAANFDSVLVEGGPSPLPLADGTLFYIYNSARAGFPSVKPNWDLQYNLGFLVLNGSDPSSILQRSNDPIFSPTLAWEIGNRTGYLTPNVVFCEGLIPLPSDAAGRQALRRALGVDDKVLAPAAPATTAGFLVGSFVGVYGAADSTLGAFRADVYKSS